MFLKEKEAETDGQHFRAPIDCAIIYKEAELNKDPLHIKFICEVNVDTAVEIF